MTTEKTEILIKKDPEYIKNRVRLYYSTDLILAFKSMKSPVALEMLNADKKIIEKDYGLLILDGATIKFTSIKSVFKIIRENYASTIISECFNLDGVIKEYSLSSIYEISHFFENAQEVRIGKLAKEITGIKNDSLIEEFVNEFKSIFNKDEIEIISGDDIAKWYDKSLHYSNNGSLGNSCMASKPKSYFDIYTKNPEVCRLVIIKKFGLLVARAFVWKIDSAYSDSEKVDIEYFLDRQYSVSDHYVNVLRNWALDQGWAVKKENNHQSCELVTYKGESKKILMTVKLKKGDFEHYPYLDTFRNLDPKNSTLVNWWESDLPEMNGNFLLHNTSGGYEIIKSLIYSKYHQREIPIRESVFSGALDDYILKEESIRVYKRGYYPINHADIVSYSDIFYHKDDFVYSGIHDEKIPIYLVHKCIINLDSKGLPVLDYVKADDCSNFTGLKYINEVSFYYIDRNWYPIIPGIDDISCISNDLLDENKCFKFLLVEGNKSKNEDKYFTKIDDLSRQRSFFSLWH